MQNSTPLQLLEYVETALDMQLEKFYLYEKIDSDITNRTAKTINNNKRRYDKEIKKINEEKKIREQAEMRAKKKAERESQTFVGGKKSAFRSNKPAMAKKDNGPAKLDEET